MIILSARKFRDNQNEILKKALEEEVILTTIHYGNFRLVPIREGEESKSEALPREEPSLSVEKLEIPKVSASETFSKPAEELPESSVSARPSWVPSLAPSSPEDMAPDPLPEVSRTEDVSVKEEPVSVKVESAPSAPLAEHKGEVYVDPSLLTLEEFYEREGLDVGNKRKGLFGKMFGKK